MIELRCDNILVGEEIGKRFADIGNNYWSLQSFINSEALIHIDSVASLIYFIDDGNHPKFYIDPVVFLTNQLEGKDLRCERCNLNHAIIEYVLRDDKSIADMISSLPVGIGWIQANHIRKFSIKDIEKDIQTKLLTRETREKDWNYRGL